MNETNFFACFYDDIGIDVVCQNGRCVSVFSAILA